MENVTREVISDLWPLYASGEVSPDTKRLVEAFLGEDPEFARMIEDSGGDRLRFETPALTPDHELQTLQRIRRKLAGPVWLLRFALIFSCLAFGRIISDTSFDVSPRYFIATAMVAVCFWIVFLVRLFRGRRSVLVRWRA